MLLVFAVHQGVNEGTLHVSRGSSRYFFSRNIRELTKHPISFVNGNQRKGTNLIVAVSRGIPRAALRIDVR